MPSKLPDPFQFRNSRAFHLLNGGCFGPSWHQVEIDFNMMLKSEFGGVSMDPNALYVRIKHDPLIGSLVCKLIGISVSYPPKMTEARINGCFVAHVGLYPYEF